MFQISYFILLLFNISFLFANQAANEYDILSNVKNSKKIEQAIQESKSSQQYRKNTNKPLSIAANSTINSKPNNASYTQTVTLVDINKQVQVVLDKINQVNAQLETKINAGMTDLDTIKQRLPQIDTEIEQIAIYVKGLGKALSVLSAQMKNQQQALDEYIISNIGKPVSADSQEPGLVINSMIATRAWMQTITGQKFSVGIGDSIPGYGKVVAINIKENFLLTDLDIKIKR